VSHAALDAGAQQIAGPAGVIAVVLEGLAYRLGDDGEGREVQHRVDVVLAEHPADEFPVADVALDERRIERGPAEAPGEVVEDNQALAALAQFERRVAADVTGSARHENAACFHVASARIIADR